MASRAAPHGDDISSRTIVLIPARLGSTRLPDKPLALIAGAPMIVQVWRRAREAAVGPVVVACAEPAIAEAVRAAGGEAVLTDPALPSGTDRIFAALQASTPSVDSSAWSTCRAIFLRSTRAVRQVLEPLEALGTDMATLANADRGRARRCTTPTWSRPWSASPPDRPELGRALYFTRATAPSGPGPVWHHIGIYAFTPRRPGAVRGPAAEPAGAARAAGAVARPGERHEHRRAPGRRGAVRRRHSGRSGEGAADPGVPAREQQRSARPTRSGRSPFRARPAPTRTSPAARPSPSSTPCPATRSRTPSPPCARARRATP